MDDLSAFLSEYALKPMSPTTTGPEAAYPSKRKRNASSADNRTTKKSRMDNSMNAQLSKDSTKITGRLSKPSQTGPQKNAGARSTRVKENVYDVPQDHAEGKARETVATAKRRAGRPKGTTKPSAHARKTTAKPVKQARTIEPPIPTSLHGIPQADASPPTELKTLAKTKASSEKPPAGSQDDGNNHHVVDGAEQNEQPPADVDSDRDLEDDAYRRGKSESIRDPLQHGATSERQGTMEAEDDALPRGDETELLSETTGPREIVHEKNKMLLGQDDRWQSISDAIAGNRKVNRKDDGAILTESIKELITVIKESQYVYKDIAKRSQKEESFEDLNEQINSCLDNMEDLVEDLEQHQKRRKTREIVQDVYAYAVPQFIRLLKVAMTCRVLNGPVKKAYDLAGLREVVRVQEVTLLLCKKVASWDLKPVTDAPMTRNIKQRVYPYLRDMSKSFRAMLKHEEIMERRRQNERKYTSQEVQANTPPQEKQRRRAARIEDQNRRIQASIDEEMAKWRRQYRQPVEWPTQDLNDSRSNEMPAWIEDQGMKSANIRQISQSTERNWTEEEDKALVDQLTNNKYTRILSGKYHTAHISVDPG